MTTTPRDRTTSERYDDALFNVRQAVRDLSKAIDKHEMEYEFRDEDGREWAVDQLETVTQALDKLTEEEL